MWQKHPVACGSWASSSGSSQRQRRRACRFICLATLLGILSSQFEQLLSLIQALMIYFDVFSHCFADTCWSWRSLTLTSAFKLRVGMSEKRWSLLIGEHKAATASAGKKRTTVKRIGSMADMQCFLKFIRVFRQSRGVSGKFTRPCVDWMCEHKQTKSVDFLNIIDFHPLAIRSSVLKPDPRIERWFSHQNTQTQEIHICQEFSLLNTIP